MSILCVQPPSWQLDTLVVSLLLQESEMMSLSPYELQNIFKNRQISQAIFGVCGCPHYYSDSRVVEPRHAAVLVGALAQLNSAPGAQRLDRPDLNPM